MYFLRRINITVVLQRPVCERLNEQQMPEINEEELWKSAGINKAVVKI